MHRTGFAFLGGLAVAAVITLAPVASPAYADTPVVPRPDTPCSPHLANVKTVDHDSSPDPPPTVLMCQNLGTRGYVWKSVPLSLPITKWLSVGPDDGVTLLGERHEVNTPSSWVGTPQDEDAQCIAEQEPLLRNGYIAELTAVAGGTGRPLSFDVVANLFSLKVRVTASGLRSRADVIYAITASGVHNIEHHPRLNVALDAAPTREQRSAAA